MDSDAIFDQMFSQGRGRARAQDTATYLRDVEVTDVLALERPREIQPIPIQKIRSSHHMLAKLLAEGRSPAEAQLITGYSLSRISNLQIDPTFKELVETYRVMVTEIYIDVHQRLSALGLNSIEELQERLDSDPNSFANKELMELAALTLDRAGFGPKSTVNHNVRGVLMTDETLKRIKAEADSRRRGVLRTLSDGGEVIDSFPESYRASARDEEAAAARSESKGDLVRAEVRKIPTIEDKTT